MKTFVTNPKIEADYFKAIKNVDEMIALQIKKGDDVIWTFGKYKDRRAQVTLVTWDEDYNPNRINVHIRVKTYRIGSHKGLRGSEPFIDDNDLIHRRYYPLSYFKREGE